MQPSNQLKGLVESYGKVGTDDYHENKKLERTLVNAIGVQMVSEGYTEDDVEEFVSEASDGKLLAKFEEALQNESVTAYITEDGTFDTKLRYVEGAIHARLHEMRPGGAQTKTQRQKDIEARGGKDTGLTAKVGRAIRDFLNPPRSKSADPVVRAGGSYTAPGGGPVLPKKPETKPAKPAAPAAETKPAKPAQPAAETKPVKPAKPAKPAQPTATTKPAAPAKPAAPKLSAKDQATNKKYDRLRSQPGGTKAGGAAEKFGKAAAKAKFGDQKPKTPNPLMSRFKKSPARTAELAKLRADAKAKSMAQSAANKTRGPQRRGARFEENEFELVVQHLVSEGIAASSEGALVMLEGMSEEFIINILEKMQMGAAMVEFLIQNGEAESLEEANYIISEMDEEAIDILAEQVEEIMESMASANRMKELEKERLSNRAPSVKYPAKPAPYGGARSREFEKRLPKPQSQKARSREFEHGSTRSSDTPSGNLGDGLPRDKKGNIMR